MFQLRVERPYTDAFTVRVTSGNRTVERYSGHKALWLRVIIRAAFDLASYKNDPRLGLRKYADNAQKWLFDRSYLFNSFENVCIMLNLPPEPIRHWATSLTKEEVQKMEHLERGSTKTLAGVLPSMSKDYDEEN